MYLPSLWERAALALNCLTEYCDHARGNLPYFYARLSEQPPSAMLHLWSYGDGLGRSLDALALLRRMMGQSVMDYQGDRTMIASLISLLGVDNLSWCPAEPWTMAVPHTRPAWLQQGTLQAFASLYQVTGDEEYRRLAEANIEAVRKLAVWNAEKQYAYFPGDYYTRANGWGPALDDPMHRPSVFYTSMAMPLLRYFRLTGHEPALALASGLIRWALADHDDGRRLFELGHFHCQSRLVTALLLRGISTSNDEDMALAERQIGRAHV